MPPILPVELLENIIDQLNNDFDNHAFAALLNLSLTCRKLLPRSRYHLLSNLFLKTRKRLYSFCEFLDSNPRYRPLVYQITIAFDQSPFVKTQTLIEHIPIPLLALPNLRQWRISGFFGPTLAVCFSPATVGAFRKYGTSIQKLQVTSLCFASLVEFANVVGMFPGLLELSCRQFWYPRRGSEVALTRAKLRLSEQLHLKVLRATLMVNLRVREAMYRLEFDGSRFQKGGVNHAAVEMLLQSAASSLEVLNLELNHHVDNGGLGAIIPQLLRLRSLTLLFVLPNEETTFNSTIGKTIELLDAARLCNLETLNLEFHTSSLGTLTYHATVLLEGLQLCRALEEILLSLPLRSLWARVVPPGRSPSESMAPAWEMTLGRAFGTLCQRGVVRVEASSERFPSGPSERDAQADVTCRAASLDGRWTAKGRNDSIIIVRDMAWKPPVVRNEWIAHGGSGVVYLAFTPNGRYLLSEGGDRRAAVWDSARNFEQVKEVPRLDGRHTKAQSDGSPDETIVASSSAS